ncbi:hypothetical protein [Mobiluncus mulieris]|uniref:hypothetical protein n=1 Tax=Mobiluncus mulieris TaxID=2052 RepID=UPI002433058F|nr:hypothetical protein [Mobiluncus mulieris]
MCAKNPEVTLNGYAIGPSRTDERVTIDALTVDNNVFNVDPDEENKEWVWGYFQEKYGFEAEAMPDEIGYEDTDGGGAWRFWWD